MLLEFHADYNADKILQINSKECWPIHHVLSCVGCAIETRQQGVSCCTEWSWSSICAFIFFSVSAAMEAISFFNLSWAATEFRSASPRSSILLSCSFSNWILQLHMSYNQIFSGNFRKWLCNMMIKVQLRPQMGASTLKIVGNVADVKSNLHVWFTVT